MLLAVALPVKPRHLRLKDQHKTRPLGQDQAQDQAQDQDQDQGLQSQQPLVATDGNCNQKSKTT